MEPNTNPLSPTKFTAEQLIAALAKTLSPMMDGALEDVEETDVLDVLVGGAYAWLDDPANPHQHQWVRSEDHAGYECVTCGKVIDQQEHQRRTGKVGRARFASLPKKRKLTSVKALTPGEGWRFIAGDMTNLAETPFGNMTWAHVSEDFTVTVVQALAYPQSQDGDWWTGLYHVYPPNAPLFTIAEIVENDWTLDEYMAMGRIMQCAEHLWRIGERDERYEWTETFSTLSNLMEQCGIPRATVETAVTLD